jgi:uncharacterized membrane protein YpjA
LKEGPVLQQELSFSFLLSKPFLTSKVIVWTLFIVNLAGTLYGFEWYWSQMMYTITEKPLWYVWFVPDSPTASLFFTLTLLYLIRDGIQESPLEKRASALRGFVEAFALITSFKYGIWAVAMIVAGAAQGNIINWQDWMLTVSHLGMAVEALMFARFYTYRWLSIMAVAAWTFWNDFMDYHHGIFPGLPDVLMDDLGWIEKFTISLSVIGIGIAVIMMVQRKTNSKTTE